MKVEQLVQSFARQSSSRGVSSVPKIRLSTAGDHDFFPSKIVFAWKVHVGLMVLGFTSF